MNQIKELIPNKQFAEFNMSGYDTDIREFDILSENEKNLLK